VWIDESDDALRLIDHAAEEARRWHERGENERELWQGKRAAEVWQALERFGKTANPALDRFLRPQPGLIKQLDQKLLPHERRELIGRLLADFSDPRPGVDLRPDGIPDIEWVDLPGGRVKLENIEQLQDIEEKEKKVETVFDMKPFRISRYLVTNVQFEAFVKAADGYEKSEWWKDIEQSEFPNEPSWQESNSPRETVSWYEAIAFCRWLTHKYRDKGLLQKNTDIRLPTEWQWQHAATGGDGDREYPWPVGWDPNRCNSRECRLNRTMAVGMYLSGATVHGVLDMAGNVWEWCLNMYENPDALTANDIDKSGGERVIRGGSWVDRPGILRSSFRYSNAAVFRDNSIGFRLAQDIE
jgi:formylglycine-generating enzyme required for sulfatase activity